MSDPHQPEDPIWSRWRERHGQPGVPQRDPAPSSDPPENGSGADKARTAPAHERLPFGAPLPPGWDRGSGGESRQDRDDEPTASRHATQEHECLEWCPVCRTADLVRASVPPELRSQLEGVQRDALVAVRALLDHYIDRLDAQDESSPRVEDIPIS